MLNRHSRVQQDAVAYLQQANPLLTTPHEEEWCGKEVGTWHLLHRFNSFTPLHSSTSEALTSYSHAYWVSSATIYRHSLSSLLTCSLTCYLPPSLSLTPFHPLTTMRSSSVPNALRAASREEAEMKRGWSVLGGGGGGGTRGGGRRGVGET